MPHNLSIDASPDVQLLQGAATTLSCNALGGPTLDYTWILPSNEKVNTTNITISDITEEDDGIYICSVMSEAGISNISTTLIGQLPVSVFLISIKF